MKNSLAYEQINLAEELKNIFVPKVASRNDRLMDALEHLSKAANLFEETDNLKQANLITDIIEKISKGK